MKLKPRFTALLAATALFTGSLLTIGAFKLTDSFGTTKVVHTTTVVSGNMSIRNAESDPQALYANTSGGVVDISTSGGSGSGFVVDSQGDIATAAHVVDGASSINVRFKDGTTRKARVLGTDKATDVAVLKVDPAGLTLQPLALGSSASLRVGDGVAAIGDPFGYERSFSTGVVSGLDRTIQAPNGFTVAHAIQTDTAVNPGNSGGPMLTSTGKVIGIVDQIATGGSGADQSSGVGFAVPIDLVKSELQTLEAGRQVQHAYIGLGTSEAGGDTGGAFVGQVAAGGPASRAGVKAGDVITAIDGRRITGSSDMVATIASHKPGDKLTLTVARSGGTDQLTVTLGVQPSTDPVQG
jgi:putative serine protease PepD